ncbi:lactonase family protein [uncultured Leifsonia sp.]|uniref:lactonase family protein n=1 Tax=uncultured Leifsonia sp. TaxID=340359 RepID=UPI0028D159AF|nr:lactonase family protein [uncultured Leifsonia sp.]
MDHRLLIGTYTERLPHVDGIAPGLLSATFDGTRLSEARLEVPLRNPSWLAVAPGGGHVYAVEETGPDGAVATIELRDGGLYPRGVDSAGGDSPAHVVVHPSGRFLLTGTYGSGTVSVYAIAADGTLGERTAFVQHEGHGPDPARQDAPHVHQLSVDPVTGDVVVVDLGLGEVRWYALSEDGALALRPEATVVTGASGPRHLAFHPDGRHALLVNELDSTLDVLRRDGDRFVRAHSVSTRSPGADGPNLSAAVRVSADGGTVLVTNRGDDTVAVFAFDAAASRVAFVSAVPAGGATPRDLVLSPEGDRVLVACQDGRQVTVFAFDPAGRVLTPLSANPVPTPVCLVFL